MEIRGVKIEFLGHSGFLVIGKEGERIVIDPYNVSNNIEKVDLMLITHSHYDHCSISDVEKLSKKGTTIVIPPDAQSKITKVDGVDMQIIEVGDEFNFKDIKIESVPAYNVRKEYHPKKEGWMGYLIKIGDVIIYHAGDSDNIPEMKKLTGYGKQGNEFIALLPVSGKYVMDAEEAAEVATFLSPTLAIPMHFGAGVGTLQDAEKFVQLCQDNGINAEVLERI